MISITNHTLTGKQKILLEVMDGALKEADVNDPEIRERDE